MAIGTIPAPTLAAIAQVVQTYATSPPQTQLYIRQRLREGLGLTRITGVEDSARFPGLRVARTQSSYDDDFYAWTQEQAALLRAGAVHDLDLDLDNLAEEIESLGKRDRRALGSHLRNLLLHLLKWQYQPEGRLTGQSWRSSIRTARAEIAAILDDSPSLEREVAGLLARWYPLAREDAADETRLPLATFPENSPWDETEVLRPDFWPDGDGGITTGLP